jgi:hypothetical protein
VTPKVVILLSDKRSGSTMFEREMCKHPEVAHVTHTPHSYNETHYWVKAASLLAKSGEGFAGEVIPTAYGSRDAIRRSLLKTIQLNVPEFEPSPDDETLVYSGWEALCQRFAQPVFFEKSPQHVHHRPALDLIATWIKQTTFQIKIIGLIRNPMAVMYSAQELFYTKPEQRQYGWQRGNENILRFADQLDSSTFRLCFYEQIVGAPREQFGEICDFIGIERNSDIGSSVTDASLQKWRQDVAYTFQLSSSVRRFAVGLGYADEDLHNPEKPPLGMLKRAWLETRRKYRKAGARFRDQVRKLSQ